MSKTSTIFQLYGDFSVTGKILSLSALQSAVNTLGTHPAHTFLEIQLILNDSTN
jgi:hypothetical protein